MVTWFSCFFIALIIAFVGMDLNSKLSETNRLLKRID